MVLNPKQGRLLHLAIAVCIWSSPALASAGVPLNSSTTQPVLRPYIEEGVSNSAPLPGNDDNTCSVDCTPGQTATLPETIDQNITWSLPARGPILSGAPVLAPEPKSSNEYPPATHLRGLICTHDIDLDLATRIDSLMSSAILKTEDSTLLDKQVAHYGTRTQKSRFATKDVLINYLGLPRGLDYSIEGSKLILNDDADIKSLPAAQFMQQKKMDQLHTQIVEATLQLAESLGCHEMSHHQELVAKALARLVEISGPDEANVTAQMLNDWNQQAIIQRLTTVNWTAEAFRKKIGTATEIAIRYDPVATSIRNKLEKYCNYGKLSRVSAKVVEGTVSAVTMLGPGLGIPVAAQLTGAAYGLSHGGSEEDKLLKEIYFEKRLESRRRSLYEESQLALFSYQQARQQHNLVQLMCAEAMLAQLVGAVGIPQIVESPAVLHRNMPVQALQTAQAASMH